MLSTIALLLKYVLWGAMALAVILLLAKIFQYRGHISSFFPKPGFRKDKPGTTLFELDISPDSLPADIPLAVRQLVDNGKQREAMGLLYRGTLSRLVHNHSVNIPDSATERECVALVHASQPTQRHRMFSILTDLWLKAAYSNTKINNNEIVHLCDQWTDAFDTSGAVV